MGWRRVVELGVLFGVLGWCGAGWAWCPEREGSEREGSEREWSDRERSELKWSEREWECREEGRASSGGARLGDRRFLVFDWGFDVLWAGAPATEVFDGGGLGTTMRLGGGFEGLSGLMVLSSQTLFTSQYRSLQMFSLGLEGRWYVPLQEALTGPRLWVSGGLGWTWLIGCEEDGNCKNPGVPALADQSGLSGGVGLGLALFTSSSGGFFVEARFERQHLWSEAPHSRGDASVLNVGLLNIGIILEVSEPRRR